MSEHASTGAALLERITRETARFATLQVFGAFVTGAATLILARLLDPRAFGVYAIGTFFLGLGSLLGDGGLGATLLRKKGDVTDDEYHVTATFLFALGAALAVTFFVTAPFIAVYNHLTAREGAVLRAMAPLFLAGPLRAVPYIRLERELRFGEIGRIELLSLIARQLAAVAFAWAFGGAWALAGAQITGMLSQLALAYMVSPGAPKLLWRPAVLAPLLGYGVRVQALGIAAFFKDNISAALLGRLVGPQAVGVFDFGVKYAQLPVLAVNALARVQLPAYARFEAHDPALHRAVATVTRTALLLGVAMLVTMSAGASSIIPFAYAPRWIESVPVVWGLLPNMVGGLVAGPLFTLLQAQGRAGLALRAFAVWTLATWALVLAVRHHGLGAIAAAHGVITVAMVLWLIAWAGHHMGRPLWRFYVGPVSAGLGAVTLVFAARRVAPWMHAGWASALAALASYVGLLMVIEGRRTRDDVASLVRALVKRR
jgi:PST family polysaccharide transporter